MSWGALNNQRERTSTEPLPEFLTGQASKNFSDRSDPQFQNAEDVVVRKSERQHYASRQESSRGYGLTYSGSINIQLSKKTLFVSVVFFVMVILATFCVGYAVGNLSVSMAAGQTNSIVPTKKPIIPARKKIKQDVRTATENIESVATAADLAEPSINKAGDTASAQEENTPHVSSEKNNNKENDSETIDDAPLAAADKNDVAD
ncbi:hypothetical protein [Candidatus Bodocaedibacter vickermanii]|uniref:Uncharacterized protein n=1 Tax=Candidatus Bodocaedibacter vickermanii TaxID=2741701 RepID=A0A7L9RUE2_9PROT|nr:hypothetical protein CPBP_00932 [Candidatus Paracaedibacteraceae bacterium 'Lake Konstanz']